MNEFKVGDVVFVTCDDSHLKGKLVEIINIHPNQVYPFEVLADNEEQDTVGSVKFPPEVIWDE